MTWFNIVKHSLWQSKVENDHELISTHAACNILLIPFFLPNIIVIFLLSNNLFIYQVLCILIYRRCSHYSFLIGILIKSQPYFDCITIKETKELPGSYPDGSVITHVYLAGRLNYDLVFWFAQGQGKSPHSIEALRWQILAANFLSATKPSWYQGTYHMINA